MDVHSRAFALFWRLYNDDSNFSKIIDENLKKGKIRFFNDTEWNKIQKQNFISPFKEIKEFIDLFLLGYNIGNCVGTSRQLSYSYNNVDIVSGILPILKGTLNAEKEGGHCWLETPESIIDTSLMLVIDKSLKSDLGYIEEQKITSVQLSCSPNYQARKEFVNDENLRPSKGK
ncbi:MAG: hypothetical protein ACI310_03490 [Bacilli bacterium]